MTKRFSRDPILDEVLRNRAEYCAEFNHDLDAIFQDLKKSEAESKAQGFKFVSLPPKRLPGWTSPPESEREALKRTMAEPTYLCPYCGETTTFSQAVVDQVTKNSMWSPQTLAKVGPVPLRHQFLFEKGRMVGTAHCPNAKPKAGKTKPANVKTAKAGAGRAGPKTIRKKKTWKEVDFSSFRCGCGHQLDFFENTIRELKRDSLRRPQLLEESGSGDDLHQVVFKGGEVVDVLCPAKPMRKPADAKAAKRPPSNRRSTRKS